MKKTIIIFLMVTISLTRVVAQQFSVGIFDAQTDVGNVARKGSCLYNQQKQDYTIKGAGTNIWATHDEFHFVYKMMKGDFIVRTNAAFMGKGVEAHRKWGWMARTSLDSASAHVNAVVHGDGLTSLQFRKSTNTETEEKKFSLTAADVVQLERKGNRYIMSVARSGDTFIADSVDLDLGDNVYLGLFVCSQDRKSTRLNSSHLRLSRMPSSA